MVFPQENSNKLQTLSSDFWPTTPQQAQEIQEADGHRNCWRSPGSWELWLITRKAWTTPLIISGSMRGSSPCMFTTMSYFFASPLSASSQRSVPVRSMSTSATILEPTRLVIESNTSTRVNFSSGTVHGRGERGLTSRLQIGSAWKRETAAVIKLTVGTSFRRHNNVRSKAPAAIGNPLIICSHNWDCTRIRSEKCKFPHRSHFLEYQTRRLNIKRWPSISHNAKHFRAENGRPDQIVQILRDFRNSSGSLVRGKNWWAFQPTEQQFKK